jgi:hypothetical protein
MLECGMVLRWALWQGSALEPAPFLHEPWSVVVQVPIVTDCGTVDYGIIGSRTV